MLHNGPDAQFIVVDATSVKLSPEQEAGWIRRRAAEEAIVDAAASKDLQALLRGADAYAVADAELWAAICAERTARGDEFVGARWDVQIDDGLGAFLLTDPAAYAAEIRATLRSDGDPPRTLLMALPEDQWPSHRLRELLVLRTVDGDWRPLVDIERRLRWLISGNALRPELEINRVIDALGRRDATDAREAILRLARSLPRPDQKAFSILAYALFQEARNLGMAIRPPRAYDFLGDPNSSRSREAADQGPVTMASLVLRDWVASCFGIDSSALGKPKLETDPGLTITYGTKRDERIVVRVSVVFDSERRLGRIWRVTAASPRGFHSLDVVTNDLRLDPARQ